MSIFVKHSQGVSIHRSAPAWMSLGEALRTVFPHIFEESSEECRPELKPRFSSLRVSLAGLTLSLDASLFYLYETFRNIDGVIYFSIDVDQEQEN